MTSSKRVAVYLRVSTDGQTTDNQLIELEKVVDHRGWDMSEVYIDHGVSGAKGRKDRKEFDRLIKDATRGQFEVIAAWSVDRLGRSLQDLVVFLNELNALGCDLYLHQQAIDTTSPAGRAMFQMCGVFAEFERSMISERVKSGLTRARSQGKSLGRPKISSQKEAQIRSAIVAGKGIRRICRELGVGSGTVQRVRQEASKTSTSSS